MRKKADMIKEIEKLRQEIKRLVEETQRQAAIIRYLQTGEWTYERNSQTR